MTSNETEVTQYTWSEVCLQEAGSLCTIRPQPPWDDGKNITCTVMYRNGQSVAATFEIDLNCKYLNFFLSFTFFFRECAFDEVCTRTLLACQVAVIKLIEVSVPVLFEMHVTSVDLYYFPLLVLVLSFLPVVQIA